MSTLITSRQNGKVKQARSLVKRKNRTRHGQYLVEGIHHVGQALDARAPITFILYTPGLITNEFSAGLLSQAQEQRIECYAVREDVFNSIAEKDRPQGVLAVLDQHRRELGDHSPSDISWAVALVAPQDPGNVGTILRTMDAVGGEGLILLEGGVDPYHPTAVRASMGALFWIPIIEASFDEFSLWTSKYNYFVYGAAAQANLDYRQAQYMQPGVLLMGSEQEGLTHDQMRICEKVIRLPMAGHVSSLNVAVAAGILLFHIQEQSPGRA